MTDTCFSFLRVGRECGSSLGHRLCLNVNMLVLARFGIVLPEQEVLINSSQNVICTNCESYIISFGFHFYLYYSKELLSFDIVYWSIKSVFSIIKFIIFLNRYDSFFLIRVRLIWNVSMQPSPLKRLVGGLKGEKHSRSNDISKLFTNSLTVPLPEVSIFH